MKFSKREFGFSTSVAALMAFGLVLPAGAQQAADEIVVTGTSIRGVTAVGASPVKIDRDTMLASGAGTPVEVLRQLPQVSGLGFDDAPHTAGNGAGNIQRGTAISLRGLASNATLLLIDGHRVAPTGNVFSFTEANQLPVSAIERVEVLADGSSAIYGSDAIAGVVNYIPRKRFDGLEVSTRYSTNNYVDGWGAAIIGGKSWNEGTNNDGHIVVSLDRDHRDGMLRGQSKYLRQDLTPFGGNDGRLSSTGATSGLAGNIIVPRAPGTGNNPIFPTLGANDIYGVPASLNGAKPTAAQLAATLNKPNLVDNSDFTSYTPETERYQAYVSVDQAFGDLTLAYSGFYNKRKSTAYSYANTTITAASTSAAYVPGLTPTPNASETVSFALYPSIGLSSQYAYDDTFTHTLSGKYHLPSDWTVDLSFTQSRDLLCANCIEPLNNNIGLRTPNAAVLRPIEGEVTAGRVNPYGVAAIPDAELQLFLPRARDVSRSLLLDTNFRMDGPVMELPGGTVRAAFGAEHQYINENRTSIGIQATSDAIGAFAERKVDSFYGELNVPIIGEGNAVPGIKSFVIDAALRTEAYSDFGDTTNPKVGVDWDVNDDLKLRGSWGKSFRAPNLVEFNPLFFSRVALVQVTNGAGDPAIPITNTATGQTAVVQVQGSSADVRPEKATSYSAGFDFQPHAIKGLTISATYYNVEYSDQIIGLQGIAGTFLANAANRANYAPYIIAAPQPASCVNNNPATYNPLYVQVLSRPTLAAIDQSQFCTAKAIIDSRNTNASTTKQDGIDLTTSYRMDVGTGSLTASLSGTKIFNNKQSVTPGAAEVQQLDFINFPVSLRMRGGLNWRQGPFGASVMANYIGSYTNNLPITVAGVVQAIKDVPSWTTVDLSLSYDMEKGGDAGWRNGVRVGLNVVNIADEDPPVVISANVPASAIDNQVHNPYGRQFTLQLSKAF